MIACASKKRQRCCEMCAIAILSQLYTQHRSFFSIRILTRAIIFNIMCTKVAEHPRRPYYTKILGSLLQYLRKGRRRHVEYDIIRNFNFEYRRWIITIGAVLWTPRALPIPISAATSPHQFRAA